MLDAHLIGSFSPTEIQHYCGRVSLSPKTPVEAGTVGTWTFVYEAGLYGMDIGATLKLAFRLASDWSAPQMEDPAAPDYARVVCSNPAVRLRARFDRKGHVRPWTHAVVVDVTEESMEPGDTITIVLGDRSAGGPGTRAQTFAEADFQFQMLVDPFATGLFVLLPDSPELPIVPGPAERLRLVAPGYSAEGAMVALLAKAEDKWGNLASSYRGRLLIQAFGCEQEEVMGEEDGGRKAVLVRVPHAGVHRVRVEDPERAWSATSNPIFCPAEHEGEWRLYWGDIHGQTGETVGSGSMMSYFPFARDVALLDFAAHAGNDFQITRAHYRDLQEQVRRHHDAGRFVTFLAFEWSGNTPGGGDHNVYFLHDDQPIHRSSHWQVDDWSDRDTDRYPISDVYEEYRGRNDVLVIPHIGGRRANLDYHNEELSPFIEICSVHGRFEWFAREAMARGMKVGFVANSDDHTGRPGAAFPIHDFSVRGGLTAAWAKDLTREGLWEAFKSRRIYGTSGERILLRFWADGHPMGEQYRADAPPQLRILAAGTSGIERVEIWRGAQLWQVHRPNRPSPDSRMLRVTWSGARSRGRNRKQNWDGEMRVDGARILQARTVSFDTPRDGIVAQSAGEVRWTSTTSGDPDGLLVELEMLPGAVAHFRSAALAAEIRLDELGDAELLVAADGVDGELRAAWEPQCDRPLEIAYETRDLELPAEGAAYWVKVVQEDGEVAWSSPIFVVR